ncbi:MAG: hypothetical protein AVDCRST_MAG39-1716 [uncultured Sphingomonadaceae bacterium]|uniref:RNA polymerase ECF-type sigma factor n=1 Tax=uncultured Sphingomonadaceae bacterium TaxID=169976 RepID=A0A6J4SWC4_9SPHN|nr:MAG: hypothetical protein AVDCRST_MAG39-1716 [uncultured Sphingomonadaceae bacterium]
MHWGGNGADGELTELLARAQTGDADAYRRFLRGAAPFIRAVARRRLRGDEAVEDAVQEALLTVHRVRHTYEPGRPVEPWLAAIAVRRAIDIARRGGRVGRREVHDEAAYETFADPRTNAVERNDDARELRRMMDELSPGQKEAIELLKMREMSLAEASTASGQSVASLKVNVHRAIKRMRLMLAKGPPE